MTALLSLIYRKIFGESNKDRQTRKLGKIDTDLAEKNDNTEQQLIPPPTYADTLKITGKAITKQRSDFFNR